MNKVFSIGHSTLEFPDFLGKLRTVGVTAVADVRTSPFSRNSSFNRDVLKDALYHSGISYVFLGTELGGRPRGEEYYSDGIADYEKMSKSELFLRGIHRIEAGAREYRIAMMCSERSPLDCHRCLLVGRVLFGRGAAVEHILQEGTLSQDEAETQLLAMAGKDHDDMFAPVDERINDAYRRRARQIAFTEVPKKSSSGIAG